jgi:hypothetical protein
MFELSSSGAKTEETPSPFTFAEHLSKNHAGSE